MQDLDFSPQSQGRLGAPSYSGHSSSEKRPSRAKDEKGYTSLSPFFLVTMFSFSLGMVLGIFIGKARKIEKSIISKPDDLRPEYSLYKKTKKKKMRIKDQNEKDYNYHVVEDADPHAPNKKRNFTNVPSPSLSSIRRTAGKNEEARFLIKVGVYPSNQAIELTDRLNNLYGLQNQIASSCRKIKRHVQFKRLAFRVPVPRIVGQENIFVGCFKREATAIQILEKISHAKISKFQKAVIYEVED